MEQRDGRDVGRLARAQPADQHRVDEEHVGRFTIELVEHIACDVRAEPELLRHELHLAGEVERPRRVVVGGVHERAEPPTVAATAFVDRAVTEQPDVVPVPDEGLTDAQGRHEVARTIPSDNENTHWSYPRVEWLYRVSS